ncbi:MAG: dephospho-CoA kinase, partial [Treponema sp.]|nr:dephospho-CoA kinase [Treponema sp.]
IIGDKQAEILSRFSQSAASRGINLRAADGSLDRRALGKLLFKDSALLAEQEKILYPEFVARVQALIDANQKAWVDQNARGLAINAALLYKTPSLLRQCQKIIYVDAPLLVRAWRIRRRDRLPLLQIIRRIKSQKGLFKEYERFAADYGIEMVRVWNWGRGAEFEMKMNKGFSDMKDGRVTPLNEAFSDIKKKFV